MLIILMYGLSKDARCAPRRNLSAVAYMLPISYSHDVEMTRDQP